LILVPAGPPGKEDKFLSIIYAIFFILGFCASGRKSIGFIYMNEFAPKKSHAAMGSFYQTSEGMIYIILTIYYKFFSKEICYPIMFGAVLNIVILFVLTTIPESPKWLYS
jgi:hypothetical protein